jgi:formylglycine-generating enzyme required for sulfatase activity
MVCGFIGPVLLFFGAMMVAVGERAPVEPGVGAPSAARDRFEGTKAGEERTVAGMRLCWCPAGRFSMGSPPSEPERRAGEDQVEVTVTRGFWGVSTR